MSIIPALLGQHSNIFSPFSSTEIWDPFRFTTDTDKSLLNTQIDWKETPEKHIIKADLPGLNKEEVKVEVEGRILQISGERKVEKEEKTDKWHRVERRSGKFLRRFQLPENAKPDDIKAYMENGVLVVEIGKEEERKPQVKNIEVVGNEERR